MVSKMLYRLVLCLCVGTLGYGLYICERVCRLQHIICLSISDGVYVIELAGWHLGVRSERPGDGEEVGMAACKIKRVGRKASRTAAEDTQDRFILLWLAVLRAEKMMACVGCEIMKASRGTGQTGPPGSGGSCDLYYQRA